MINIRTIEKLKTHPQVWAVATEFRVSALATGFDRLAAVCNEKQVLLRIGNNDIVVGGVLLGKKELRDAKIMALVDECIDQVTSQLDFGRLSLGHAKDLGFEKIERAREVIDLVVAWSRLSAGTAKRWHLLISRTEQ